MSGKRECLVCTRTWVRSHKSERDRACAREGGREGGREGEREREKERERARETEVRAARELGEEGFVCTAHVAACIDRHLCVHTLCVCARARALARTFRGQCASHARFFCHLRFHLGFFSFHLGGSVLRMRGGACLCEGCAGETARIYATSTISTFTLAITRCPRESSLTKANECENAIISASASSFAFKNVLYGG